MNIIEVMEYAKKGYYIRRSWWQQGRNLAPQLFDFSRPLGGGSSWDYWGCGLNIPDILAEDWEAGPQWPKEIVKMVKKQLGINKGVLYPTDKIKAWEEECKMFHHRQETGEIKNA